MKYIFMIVGASLGAYLGTFIGTIIHSFYGLLFGAIIGFLFGFCFELKKQIKLLQDKQAFIYSKLIDNDVIVDETVTSRIQVDNIDIEEIALTEDVMNSEEDT